jgi:hypothetical protein
MVGKGLHPMMPFKMFLHPLQKMHFHVLWEQIHILSSLFLASSHQQVDIVLSFDGIRTLADVIIVDPIQAGLVSQDFFLWVVMLVLTQVKEGHYCDHYPMYVIFPLTIEVFECFDQQFDNFLH